MSSSATANILEQCNFSVTRHFHPKRQYSGTCGYVAGALLIQVLDWLVAAAGTGKILDMGDLQFDMDRAICMNTVSMLSSLLGSEIEVSPAATETAWLSCTQV